MGMVVAGALMAAEPDTRWDEEIAKFKSADAKGMPPEHGILFVGSSSIRMWESLAADFPDLPVYNRGFGGSHMKHLVQYFDRIVRPYAPRQIVVYSATNDITDDKPVAEVLADWATFCGMVRANLPDAKVALISVAPNPDRWDKRTEQESFNALAAAYCERNGLVFIDVWSPMLGDDGEPSRDIYLEDQLHMNAAGYDMWQGIVGPYLRK